MKILLVEDNPLDRMFLTQSLRQVVGFDYELVDCESLAAAQLQIVAIPFDVILLDLWLQDSEGLETCRRLVAMVEDIPIVVMTGANDLTLATAAMRCGAQDYLVKGAFPGSAIARVLQYAIDRFHFQRELFHKDNHFREVVSRVPAIIWTTDLALKVQNSMGAGLQLLELDSQEMVGKTLEEYFLITGNAEGAVQAHRRALDGQSVTFETEWRGRNFEVKIDPLREPSHRVSGTIGVAIDVTERRQRDREINFARLVQAALLPAEQPHLQGFDVFGGSYPATQACGDWFDYLMFPDGSLGLAAGDVCGHGFGPAILSATIAAYLEVLSESCSDVQEILDSCSHLVCKRNFGQFAVLLLARLQPGVQTLTFCGAGDGMLVVGHDGQRKHYVPASGLPLGVRDDMPYESPAQVTLDPGDVLLLLTDGFREAQNAAGELFGDSRIIATVAANSHASASAIFKALWRAARKFAEGHNQQDDMTGIVVKVFPASPSKR